MGLAAVRKNSIRPMKQYLIGLVVFGYFPLLYALIYYFTDTITYLNADPEINEEELAEVQMWQVRNYNILLYII